MSDNSTPLWRRKNDPIDKEKILAVKPKVQHSQQPLPIPMQHGVNTQKPSTNRYVPSHIKSNFEKSEPIEKVTKKVTVSDFPALGGNSKRVPQTPKNTPDVFNFLEAAKKAPLKAPKSDYDSIKKELSKKETTYGDFEEPKEEYIPEQTNYQWECELESYNENW